MTFLSARWRNRAQDILLLICFGGNPAGFTALAAAERCLQNMRYRLSLNRTVSPDAAERRAASRISITTSLTARDDGPEGFNSPRTTAVKYESGSSYRGSRGCAAISSSSLPARRTRILSGPTVLARPVWP